MKLIDTHCHLDVAEFRHDYHQVLARAAAVGVSDLVVPAVTCAGWPGLLALCRQEDGCHAALGLHPLYLDRHRPQHLDELSDRIVTENVRAIGEIGLDYWGTVQDRIRRQQQELFERQVRLAKKNGLPLLLHARQAHDQVTATLRRLGFSFGGIVHAFSGSRQQAQRYLDLGFAIGVGGTITYDRAARVRGVVAALPLTSLVLETDAPDIAPAAHRRQRNSPEYLPEILSSLAELRSESRGRIAETTTRNARTVLRLP
jgi:TatD DNase family protein